MSDSAISPKAEIAPGARIGNYCVIHDNVMIDDGVVIDNFCEIGYPASIKLDEQTLRLGPKSHIRSHSVIYEGSNFSGGIETGHHVLIRENTRAGTNLRVGSFSDIEGECIIGDYGRLHSQVHIAKGSRLGDFVWLYPQVVLLNDPLPFSSLHRPAIIEDGVVICTGSTVYPGAFIRKGSLATAQSKIKGEIPAGAVVDGDSKIRGHVADMRDLVTGIRHPWMRHAADLYPPDARDRIARLLEEILATR